jgi:hypothetical protein
METKIEEYQADKIECMYQLANKMFAGDWFADEDRVEALKLISCLYNKREVIYYETIYGRNKIARGVPGFRACSRS